MTDRRPKALGGQGPGAKPQIDAVGAEFLRVLQRVDLVVKAETAALRAGDRKGLAAFNYRKGHAFLDLARAREAMRPELLVHPEVLQNLGALRTTLETNKAVLQMHLDAVQEVAGTLARVIREHESDGTYGPAHERTEYAR